MINAVLGVESEVRLVSTFLVSIDDDNWPNNEFIHYSKTNFALN